MVFLLKLMCPSKIIGTSQTGHTNLGKTSALSSCSCGCRSLRKLRDGGCWDHYISPPASQSQCPCSQLGAPHGDIRQGRREPSGGLHSRWGWGQQQEGARGKQALSGLALPRWSVLLRGCDISSFNYASVHPCTETYHVQKNNNKSLWGRKGRDTSKWTEVTSSPPGPRSQVGPCTEKVFCQQTKLTNNSAVFESRAAVPRRAGDEPC